LYIFYGGVIDLSLTINKHLTDHRYNTFANLNFQSHSKKG